MNTTTTGRAGLFLSLALDSKEYKRERERVYFYSRASSGMRRSFFAAVKSRKAHNEWSIEINSASSCVQKIAPSFSSFQNNTSYAFFSSSSSSSGHQKIVRISHFTNSSLFDSSKSSKKSSSSESSGLAWCAKKLLLPHHSQQERIRERERERERTLEILLKKRDPH